MSQAKRNLDCTKEELRVLLKEERLSVREAAERLDTSVKAIEGAKARWCLDRNPQNEAERASRPVYFRLVLFLNRFNRRL